MGELILRMFEDIHRFTAVYIAGKKGVYLGNSRRWS